MTINNAEALRLALLRIAELEEMLSAAHECRDAFESDVDKLEAENARLRDEMDSWNEGMVREANDGG